MSLFSRFAAVAALSVFAVTSVHAAPSKAAKSANKPAVQKVAANSTSADGFVTVSAEPPAEKSTVGGNATSILNTSTTEPVSKSAASLPTAIENASPRTVFGTLYTETYQPINDLSNGTGSPQLNSFAGVKVDLGNARSVEVRQNFDYTGVTDKAGANTFHVQDIAINYVEGKLATILGDGSLTIMGRVYLPTGENTRFLTKNAGAERLYLIGSKSYGKVDVAYLMMGQLSNTTKDSYINAKGEETQNRYGYGVHEASVAYNINDKFAVSAAVGQEFKFFHSLAGKQNAGSDLYLQPTLQFSPKKGLTFQAALYNEINTAQPAQDFAIAREDEVSAYFSMAASL